MVKPRSFLLELAKGYDHGLPIFDWFNRTLEVSDDGKQGIFYTLCAAYAFVSFVALVHFFLHFSIRLRFLVILHRIYDLLDWPLMEVDEMF